MSDRERPVHHVVRETRVVSARRILIIGASSVLGGAVARVLAPEETELVLTYRSERKEATLKAAYPRAQLMRCDVTRVDDILQLAKAIAADGQTLDGIVYAAGSGLLSPANRTTDQSLAEIMEININGAFRVLRSCGLSLQQGRQPAVVLISSSMGSVGAPGMSVYSASKAALVGLTRSLAIEWAPRGIRVNAVAPGIVPSPLVEEMFKNLLPDEIESIRKRHPLGFGVPDDVGQAIAFLLSPKTKWITGVVLPVDGGYTAQ